MSDEELMRQYDDAARHGRAIDFYHREFTRRMLEKGGNRMERLTWAIVALTAANVVLVAWALFLS